MLVLGAGIIAHTTCSFSISEPAMSHTRASSVRPDPVGTADVSLQSDILDLLWRECMYT